MLPVQLLGKPLLSHRLFAALALLFSISASGQDAWLVTYGPGYDSWERFGHNALWLQDRETGLDHSYSFGYFEMDRPGFYRDFARGIMNYYGAVSEAEREFAFYRGRDRSIRTQRLALDAAQIAALHQLLEDEIFPYPQYYDYDYFFNNCSTRLRDLLDEVLDGALAGQLKDRPASLNFRDHTRRLTAERFWMHSGMMLLLGPEIDRPRSAWEETFLPGSLADWLETVVIDGQALVVEDRMRFENSTHQPPETASGPWLGSVLLGLALLMAIVVPARLGQGGWSLLPWRVGLIAAGLMGLMIALMWLASGHEATWRNAMALLLHPLWLAFLLPLPGRLRRVLWWLVAVLAGAGAVVLAWPGGFQYRPDQLLWVLPLAAALLTVDWSINVGRNRRRPVSG